MDNQNQNIEDFFNKSMEQFTDAPSDGVWNAVHQRLEAEVLPFYKKWSFWALVIVGMLLLGILTCGYFSTQKSIELLTQKVIKLEKEKDALTSALNDCSLTAKTPLEKTNVNENAHFLSEGSEENLAKNIDNQSIKSNFTYPTENGLSKKSKQLYPAKTNQVAGIFKNASHPDSFQNSKDLKQANHEEKPINIARQISKMPFLKSPTLVEQKMMSSQKVAAEYRVLERLNYRQTAINSTPILYPKYRIGLMGSVLNSYTDQHDLVSLTYNTGITNEIRLFEAIYLTVGFQFGELTYKLKLNEFEQDILANYPLTDDLPFSVRYLRQHVHYLDLPLGIKWYFKDFANGNKLFIHPSISFQHYFPQRFVYALTDNFNGSFSIKTPDTEVFDFFNMGRLHIGLEKKWKNKLSGQIGFYGETGFTTFGMEQRDLFNLGLRASILFASKK